MISADELATIKRKQQAIRRTAEAMISVGEESGCNLTEVLTEVALLLAFSQNLARNDAIDMINRAHNRVVYFLQMMNWDGFVANMRTEVEAGGNSELTFEQLERDYGGIGTSIRGKTARRDRRD
jgi:hypothetical protein